MSGKIVSKPPSKEYEEGWERIFKKLDNEPVEGSGAADAAPSKERDADA